MTLVYLADLTHTTITVSSDSFPLFVQRGREGNLKVQDPTDGFVEPRFRESRNEDGSLSLLSGQKRLGPIAHLPLWDVEREETIRVGELRS